MYDYLVVGAGLFGAVFACEMQKKGKKVLVLEKREHLAGNIYTEKNEGIHIHKYGAHIFHTNDEKIWNYVNQYAQFNTFINTPKANYKGELYALPFNMNTFQQMWGISSEKEAKEMIEKQRNAINIEKPKNLEEQAISLVGKDIYEKLIKGYTQKQWGKPCNELPSFIIKRLPVRFTYDNNYYDALFQGIPVDGYTSLVEKLLEGIEVRLGEDYLLNKDKWNNIAKCVLYTGPIDAYYEYCYGALEYRLVYFETERLDVSDYQGNAVINYTDEETPWTRIIEHKWFQFGKDDEGNETDYTFISREYSAPWKKGLEPYYPINDETNNTLYEKYKKRAEKETKVFFGGRLGEYKYYDMDVVIGKALTLSENVGE